MKILILGDAVALLTYRITFLRYSVLVLLFIGIICNRKKILSAFRDILNAKKDAKRSKN